MSVSIVVGGQFGSEGKGKIAHFLARSKRAAAVVRVGGSNSGHTAVAENGRTEVLRQLPTAALLPDVLCVLGPGAYIDVALLRREIERLRLPPDRVLIDFKAMVISPGDQDLERAHALVERVGSTGSGTGGAVARRVYRQTDVDLAAHVTELRPYLGNSTARLRELVASGRRVIIEGTQGFGLSLLHGPHYPYATSRDTTAAAALSEAGLSPLDVDDVTLVIRSLPIRVGGNSGPFGAEEIDWDTVAEEGGHSSSVAEFTSVTQRVRRVSRFDAELVRQAIAINRPSTIVLNHVDLIDAQAVSGLTDRAQAFVDFVETGIGQAVDYVGVGPADLIAAADKVLAA
jgi:adenylosuccinate synthase